MFLVGGSLNSRIDQRSGIAIMEDLEDLEEVSKLAVGPLVMTLELFSSCYSICGYFVAYFNC